MNGLYYPFNLNMTIPIIIIKTPKGLVISFPQANFITYTSIENTLQTY